MSTYAGRYDEPLLKIVGRTVTAATTATAEVFEADGATLATLYTDRTKSAIEPNPVAPDGNGNLEFFADPGEYLLKLYEGSTLVRSDTITVNPDVAELDFHLDKLTLVDTEPNTVSEAVANATNPLGVNLHQHGGGPDKTAAQNTAAYNDIVSTYPGQDVKIGLGVGEYAFDPLTPAAGVRIQGAGYETVMRFVGNVVPYDDDSVDRCGISDARIIVDTTNPNPAIRVATTTAQVSQSKYRRLWIDTPDGNAPPSSTTQGVFVGVHIIATGGRGIFDCLFEEVTVNNCAKGVVIEASGAGSWVTFNRFPRLYVRTFSDTAVQLIEPAGTSVLNNTFESPNILDWNQAATTRVGIKLAGAGNVVSDLQMFNDGQNGTYYALDLDDTGIRSYGNEVTGTIEGLIRHEQNAVNHTIDVFTFKRANSIDVVSGTAPNGRPGTFQVANLLPHTEFRSDTAHGWATTGVSATVEAADPGGAAREHVRVVKTAATGAAAKFAYSLPAEVRDIAKGRWVTFTAAVRATSPLAEVMLDDGVSAARRGMRHSGSGEIEVLSTQMKVAATATALQPSVRWDDAEVNGAELDVEWVTITHGFGNPMQPVAPLRDRQYLAKAEQRLDLAAAAFGATIGAPTLGTVGGFYSAWLLDAAATETVAAAFVVPEGWTTYKAVGWFVNAGAGAGDVVVRGLVAANRADGASANTVASLGDVTFTAGAQNIITKVTLTASSAAVPGRLVLLAVERRGAVAGDTLANDVGLFHVEVQRVT